MDGSLTRVTLPKLGSLELPLQLCRNPEIPCLGSTQFFFMAYSPNRGPGAPSTLVRLAHTLFVRLEVGLGGSGTHSGFTSAKQLLVLVRALLECDRAMWLCPWPVGAPGQGDLPSSPFLSQIPYNLPLPHNG